jgi:hypothetical protein
MELPEDLLAGLDVALNEAEWHNARVRANMRDAILDFRVFALPESGPEPDERGRVVRLRFSEVGRVAASLRSGRWDDQSAAIEPFDLDELNDVVNSFEAQPIYGWHFFDPPEADWEHWRDRLSLDIRLPLGSEDHVIDLFQESRVGPDRHLDLRIWFGGISSYDLENHAVPLLDVVAAGKRWWDALFSGDERVQGHGIEPLKPDPPTDRKQ